MGVINLRVLYVDWCLHNAAIAWQTCHKCFDKNQKEVRLTVLRQYLIAAAFACVLLPATPITADPNVGAYLAGKQAAANNDFVAGARFFTRSLMADPSHPDLLESAMNSFIALGQIDRAIPIAQTILDLGHESQIANLTLVMQNAKAGNWDAIFAALEQGHAVGPLIDGLTQAWAHLGKGEITKALGSFDNVIETEGMEIYGLTHKAYALASVGDFEAAEAVYLLAADKGVLRYSRKSAMAHAQILSQLDRNDDAVQVIDGVFGNQLDPSITLLRDDLAAGSSVPFDVVNDPVIGLADVFHIIAGAVIGDAPDAFTLLYARAATYLDPDNTQAILMSAELLAALEQFDLANETYATVPADDPSFYLAELGRAEVLRNAGRDETAIEVLTALSRSHPSIPQVYAAKGDTFRQLNRLDEATRAYTEAIARFEDEHPNRWFVYYTRGIAFHLLDDWPEAEADFRTALSLRPDQPQVLNYLGYSLVERGEKLEEALGMIETAAAARPDSGAIIDSLGWVLFQMGRYQEAVGHMERAASLLPVDPVINDHLGDVYWAVGRKTEAHFQWNRALSFDPTEDEAARIRDKLARGLDLVLAAEGAAPISVARDDN